MLELGATIVGGAAVSKRGLETRFVNDFLWFRSVAWIKEMVGEARGCVE